MSVPPVDGGGGVSNMPSQSGTSRGRESPGE